MGKSNQKFTVFFAVFLVAVSSMFFECNSSKDQKTKDNSTNSNQRNLGRNPYFPVATSQVWTYINEGPRDETELISAKISGVTLEGQSATAEYDKFPYFTRQEVTRATIKVMESGDVMLADSTSTQKLLLPGPSNLTKGYEWKFGEWRAVVGDTGVTVKTDSEEIKDCIYVNYSLGGITFSVELWLAKDRGIVKWGSNRTNPPQPKILYYVLK